MTMLVKGNIEVVACFGRYGHDLRSVCGLLSAEDDLYVETMLTAGVPPKMVLFYKLTFSKQSGTVVQ